MPGTAKELSPRPVNILECMSTGLLYYYLTSLVVVLGVVFGHDFVEPTKGDSELEFCKPELPVGRGLETCILPEAAIS